MAWWPRLRQADDAKCRAWSYHMLSQCGQFIVFADSAERLEVQPCSIHGKNRWRVNCTAQEALHGTTISDAILGYLAYELTFTSSSSLTALTERDKLSSGTRRISGWTNLRMFSSVRRLYSLKHVPGFVLPARPRRCPPLLWLIRVSTRRDRPASASYRISFAMPLSMTQTTSSIVMEVCAVSADVEVHR